MSMSMSDPYAQYYTLHRSQSSSSSSSSGPSRRVYTDDSDVALCAVHAGWISWAAVRRARAVGLDLAVRLALFGGVGRFVGGLGVVALADGQAQGMGMERRDVDRGLKQHLVQMVYRDREQEARDRQAESVLESASWESGHDGSGMEVLGAEWLPVRFCFFVLGAADSLC